MEKKILVVDNHPVMLKLMASLFEKEGHQVLTAEDGLSALSILKTYTPDIIFTDLIMPRIDGKKLCQMIRKIPKLKDVYVVIFSAVAAEGDTTYFECGADACIAKAPFHKMTKHILQILNQSDQMNLGGLSGRVIGLENIHPRQITKELLSIKKHFEVILRSMTEGIIEITPEGRIVYANPTAIHLTGLQEERLLASNLIELFQETERQRIKDLLVSVDASCQFIFEYSPVGINGKELSLRRLPVIDEENQTMILLLNDLSERRRMETQLFQAQKVEAIGTLAGGIAHDFNNLLMVIQGNVSLMLSEIYPRHPYVERLRNIEKQIQSGSKLTSQLLGYARKGRYEVKPIDLNQLVEETSEVFGRTRKEITIHQRLVKDLSPIEADHGQMEQVLMNLLVNAADAMPGGGELFLMTANVTHEDLRGKVYQPKSGNYVLLTVKDTGVGMDKKTMERIFDPFFTTKELGRGTGLGLASVYGIIKGHGGYIDVESEEGKGSIFKVYIRASEKTVQETIKAEDAVVKGTGTILLIDDEDMILEVGQKWLNMMGYKTFIAHDGEEAIEVYKKYRDSVDLVILDMVMPFMGGSALFDRLKEISPNVKVLLSSGYSIDGEATEILQRGCNGFIQKPFNMEQLSQNIRAILDK